jgi:hypothetical protein
MVVQYVQPYAAMADWCMLGWQLSSNTVSNSWCSTLYSDGVPVPIAIVWCAAAAAAAAAAASGSAGVVCLALASWHCNIAAARDVQVAVASRPAQGQGATTQG